MKKTLIGWAPSISIFFGILITAFLLRIYNLTLLPVFADEAIYIRWSQVMATEPTLRFLPLSDGKQPLYMWILMFLVERFSDPLFIGRLISVCSGLGTIVGIFFLSYNLFKNKKVSLFASFLWTISPYSLFFDRMALVDSLLTMFIVWTAYLAVITTKTKRFDYAMLTGFTLGFASLTKSSAIFSAFLLPSAWILSELPKSKKKFLSHIGNLAILLIPTYVIAFAMYNIQRLGPNFHMLKLRTLDYVFPVSHAWTNPKDPFIFHFDRAIEWLRMMGPWPVLVLGVLAFVVNFKKYWREMLLLLSWWAFPTLVQSMLAKVFTARYELFTIPFLFVIAASVFVTKNKFSKIFAYTCVVIFTLLALKFNYDLLTDPQKANLPRSERSGYLEEWTAGTGIKEVADYVKELHNQNPNQKIVVGTEGYFGTLPDGLQIYLQGIPNVTVIGTGLDFGQVPDQLTVSVKSGTRTFLVANSSRISDKLENNFGEYGLTVIKSYKKADRPEKDYKETSQYGVHDTFYLLEVNPSIASDKDNL